MSNYYKRFCQLLKEKAEYDKKKDELPKRYDVMEEPPIVNFTIKHYRYDVVCGSQTEELFTLDDEDLSYLHNKYKAKLEDEMNAAIDSIKSSYKDML